MMKSGNLAKLPLYLFGLEVICIFAALTWNYVTWYPELMAGLINGLRTLLAGLYSFACGCAALFQIWYYRSQPLLR